MKKNDLLKILKEILKVESVEIKNCALESLIDKLEEQKGKNENRNSKLR